MIKGTIYWFTGQPGSGKTILGEKLLQHFKETRILTPTHIDGDDLREVITNKDYSEKGRINNVRTAQNISKFLQHKHFDVIVSLVSPYKWLRDEFKMDVGMNIKEIYVHTTEERERDHFHVKNYEPPTGNFIDVDTTFDTPDESIIKLINKIEKNNV